MESCPRNADCRLGGHRAVPCGPGNPDAADPAGVSMSAPSHVSWNLVRETPIVAWAGTAYRPRLGHPGATDSAGAPPPACRCRHRPTLYGSCPKKPDCRLDGHRVSPAPRATLTPPTPPAPRPPARRCRHRPRLYGSCPKKPRLSPGRAPRIARAPGNPDAADPPGATPAGASMSAPSEVVWVLSEKTPIVAWTDAARSPVLRATLTPPTPPGAMPAGVSMPAPSHVSWNLVREVPIVAWAGAASSSALRATLTSPTPPGAAAAGVSMSAPSHVSWNLVRETPIVAWARAAWSRRPGQP
jgi:hypothetical protein